MQRTLTRCRHKFTAILLSTIPFTGLISGTAQANIIFPEDATSVLNIKTDFGAKGDGVADDTDAFIKAMDRMVSQRDKGGYLTYVPDGIYRITRPIVYSGNVRMQTGGITNELSDTMRFIGQSRDGTVLKLIDNAPGFGYPDKPAAMISFGKSTWGKNNNRVSGNLLKHLTIDVGLGNPGAIGLVFHGANNATVVNVLIKSSDPQRTGHTGFLDPWGAAHGYYKNIEIEGFSVGIEYLAELVASTAWENLVLRNQTRAGIRLGPMSMAIRKLKSIQCTKNVPAIVMNDDRGQAILLDSELKGIGQAAVEIHEQKGRFGQFLGRNVSISGYDSGIVKGDSIVVNEDITEYASNGYQALCESQSKSSLNLPIEETPDIPWETDMASWVNVSIFGASGDGKADDTAAIQAAMDSGKPVIYFPSGTFLITRPISIPTSVKQVQFLFCGLRTTLTREEDTLFVVEGDSQDPLLLEGLYLWKVEQKKGNSYLLNHASRRTVVLRDAHWQGGGRMYYNTVTGGKLFIENTSGRVVGGKPNFRFIGQKVYARWLNPEYGRPYVLIDGSTLWMMGMKGEKARVAFEFRNGARGELLGFVQNNFSSSIEPTLPVIVNHESHVAAFGYTDGRSDEKHFHRTIVQETRNGTNRMLMLEGLPKRINKQDMSNSKKHHPWISYVGHVNAAANDNQPLWLEKDGIVSMEAEHGINPSGLPVITRDKIDHIIRLDNERWNVPAEHYRQKLRETWDEAVSGGQVLQMVEKGAELIFEFETETPGEWLLVLRHYCGHHMTNGIYLRLDDTHPRNVDKLMFSKADYWQNRLIRHQQNGQYGGKAAAFLEDISPGRHVLRLIGSGEAILVDKIVLISKNAFEKWADLETFCRPTQVQRCLDWNLGPKTTLSPEPTSLPETSEGVSLSGELKQWHAVTLTFDGPETSEHANLNPFTDYRLNITFRQGKQCYTVPGFYAADGNAANTGAQNGRKWRVHFNPPTLGIWQFEASFRTGPNVAVSVDPQAGKAIAFNGATGRFEVRAGDKVGVDFRRHGWLQYDKNGTALSKHYLKFKGAGHFLKTGIDEPENLLAYNDFDNTLPSHDYSEHLDDWNPGDPTWGDGRGRGLIGAINYLSQKHINSLYFLPMNIGGGLQDTWPYAGPINPKGSQENDNTRFDCSKLAQWNLIFSHAQSKGLALNFVLAERQEPVNRELDNGQLGLERMLYTREMVARFAHHNALVWNLSEEFNEQIVTYDTGIAWAQFLYGLDPYDHAIGWHNSTKEVLVSQRNYFGLEDFGYVSVQYHYWPAPPRYKNAIQKTVADLAGPFGTMIERYRLETAAKGRPLPIWLDEPTFVTPQDDESDGNQDARSRGMIAVRKECLWPALMSGAAGIEFLTVDHRRDDFRAWERLYEYEWYARKFFEQYLPFWDMEPMDDILAGEAVKEFSHQSADGGHVLAQPGKVYAVYMPDASLSANILLPPGEWRARWYSPRIGEFVGKATWLLGGQPADLGAPPEGDPHDDWALLVMPRKDH